jgi:hypothetical protein
VFGEFKAALQHHPCEKVELVLYTDASDNAAAIGLLFVEALWYREEV